MSREYANASGNLDAAEEAVTLNTAGLASGACQVTGTFSGTVAFEGTIDNTNWVSINSVTPTGTIATTTTTTGIFMLNCAAFSKIRARCSAYTSGTITVVIQAVDEANVTTSATSITASIGSDQVDDAAFTPGTDNVSMMGAEFDDTTPDSVDEGDGGAVRMSANRNLYTTIRDAAGNERGVNVNASNELTVVEASGATIAGDTTSLDGKTPALGTAAMAGAVPVTIATDDTISVALDTAVDAINTKLASGTVIGDVNLGATDNAVLDAIDTAIDAINAKLVTGTVIGDVNLGATDNAVLDAIASDADIASGWDNAASDGASVSGDVAHDTADAGEPVKVGGIAVTANPTAVGALDRVNAIFDDVGKQVVVGSVRDLKSNQHTTITSSTSETTVLTAVAATFLDVYGVIVTNSSATATEVTFKDSTTGTTRFVISAPANDTRGFMLPESAAHKQATVNNNWTATCADSVASIEITMMAVQNV